MDIIGYEIFYYSFIYESICNWLCMAKHRSDEDKNAVQKTAAKRKKYYYPA